MPTIVSFINLKGGVGKTTLTVNLAATLANHYQKRVLVIDLDPQTNATVSLISQDRWKEINDNEKQTLYHLFNDILHNKKDFDLSKAIQKNVAEVSGLDLLPSSLNLVEIQDSIMDIGHKGMVSPFDVIRSQISRIENEYDFIFIDCPPNLGVITINGILISDFYVIPTTPDILSKIGISLITNRIEQTKSKRSDCKIELAGIVFTKVDNRTNLHASTKSELRHPSYFLHQYVYQSELPIRTSIAEAPADYRPHATSPLARGKRDWRETQEYFRKIIQEFLKFTQPKASIL
jgi:chromosome partitioning protein